MDAFEAKYLSGTGEVFFRDKLRIPKWVFAMLPASMLAMVLFGWLAFPAGAMSTLLPLSLVGIPLIFLANLALMGIRMVVSEGGLDIAVGARTFNYPLDSITAVERSWYRFRDYPLGRGQVKWGPKGRAFVGGLLPTRQEGVVITTVGGKRTLITSSDPAGLEAAIRAALDKAAGGGMRVGVAKNRVHVTEDPSFDEHRFDEHRFDEHRFDEHRFDEHRFDEHRFDEHRFDDEKAEPRRRRRDRHTSGR
jgi:hypothetical protein